MNGTRLRSLLPAVCGLALLAAPAAAQPSTTAGLIDDLNRELLYVAIPVTVLVELILVYTVLRFKDADEPKPTRENRRLEITWTVATAIVLLFVGVASYGVLANPAVTYTTDMAIAPEPDDVRVEAVAFQWGWEMNYPEHNITSLTGSETTVTQVEGPVLVLPKGQEVYITVTSRDVIHSFHVPTLALKQDAIPGQRNTLKTTPLETGTYQGYCAEFCGVGHSEMLFTVVVVDQSTYQQFIRAQTPQANQTASGSGTATGNGTASGNETTTGNATA